MRLPTTTTRLPILFGLLVLLWACGDDAGPVESGDMMITINSMNSSDIRTPGTVQKDENIGTETQTPWADLVDRAEVECMGDPAGFEVVTAAIALDEGSDITSFEDVIDGTATVFFADVSGNDAAATKVDVASVDRPTGPGPVTLTVVATRSSLQPLHRRLVGGDFRVGLRAATSLTGDDIFSMDVAVSLEALAFCK